MYKLTHFIEIWLLVSLIHVYNVLAVDSDLSLELGAKRYAHIFHDPVAAAKNDADELKDAVRWLQGQSSIENTDAIIKSIKGTVSHYISEDDSKDASVRSANSDGVDESSGDENYLGPFIVRTIFAIPWEVKETSKKWFSRSKTTRDKAKHISDICGISMRAVLELKSNSPKDKKSATWEKFRHCQTAIVDVISSHVNGIGRLPARAELDHWMMEGVNLFMSDVWPLVEKHYDPSLSVREIIRKSGLGNVLFELNRVILTLMKGEDRGIFKQVDILEHIVKKDKLSKLFEAIYVFVDRHAHLLVGDALGKYSSKIPQKLTKMILSPAGIIHRVMRRIWPYKRHPLENLFQDIMDDVAVPHARAWVTVAFIAQNLLPFLDYIQGFATFISLINPEFGLLWLGIKLAFSKPIDDLDRLWNNLRKLLFAIAYEGTRGLLRHRLIGESHLFEKSSDTVASGIAGFTKFANAAVQLTLGDFRRLGGVNGIAQQWKSIYDKSDGLSDMLSTCATRKAIVPAGESAFLQRTRRVMRSAAGCYVGSYVGEICGNVLSSACPAAIAEGNISPLLGNLVGGIFGAVMGYALLEDISNEK